MASSSSENHPIHAWSKFSHVDVSLSNLYLYKKILTFDTEEDTCTVNRATCSFKKEELRQKRSLHIYNAANMWDIKTVNYELHYPPIVFRSGLTCARLILNNFYLIKRTSLHNSLKEVVILVAHTDKNKKTSLDFLYCF